VFQDRLMMIEYQFPAYDELVEACQRANVRLLEYHKRFPRQEPAPGQRYRSGVEKTLTPAGHAPRQRQGLLPAPRDSTARFQELPPVNKRDSVTPGPRASPARETDPTKATCFSCSEVGHFANSCPNPRKTPRFHEIEQDTEASGDDEANDEDNTDESEN
jgi:hypothetical protein